MSQNQRTAILELAGQGVSRHEIARVLKVSRGTVKKVLRSGSAAIPPMERAEKCEPYRQQILELIGSCKGNLVRVLEELSAQGADLSYSALTAWCRRHGIGQAPVVPAGRYHFSPSEELQHDTSPHQVKLGGKLRKVREYPREPLVAAVAEAERYGLYDLDRVERMILRRVARDYFLLNNDPESES